MMDDFDTYRGAKIVIDQYGQRAGDVAKCRADGLLNEGDSYGGCDLVPGPESDSGAAARTGHRGRARLSWLSISARMRVFPPHILMQ